MTRLTLFMPPLCCVFSVYIRVVPPPCWGIDVALCSQGQERHRLKRWVLNVLNAGESPQEHSSSPWAPLFVPCSWWEQTGWEWGEIKGALCAFRQFVLHLAVNSIPTGHSQSWTQLTIRERSFFFPHSCQPPRSNTTGLNWHVPVTPVRLCLCSFVDWLTCWIRSRAHEVAGNLPSLPHRSHNALLFWVFLWFMLIAAPELMLKTKNGLKKNWEQAGVQKSMLKS